MRVYPCICSLLVILFQTSFVAVAVDAKAGGGGGGYLKVVKSAADRDGHTIL